MSSPQSVIRSRSMGGHERPIKGVTDSWITPKMLVDALGEFDLDPCQCLQQPWPCAKVGYTEQDDGLAQNWAGRIWLNPPYSAAWQWMERLAAHGRGTALIFARTETEGFVREVWGKATAILFLKGRLCFHRPDGTRAKGNSGAPSCLVAYGADDAAMLAISGLPGALVKGWRT